MNGLGQPVGSEIDVEGVQRILVVRAAATRHELAVEGVGMRPPEFLPCRLKGKARLVTHEDFGSRCRLNRATCDVVDSLQ